MKYCFILNPAAGKGERVHTLAEEIEAGCRSRGLSYEVYFTKCIGDATDYIRRTVKAMPEEEYRFYSCGGDGTLCETVSGAMSVADIGNVSVGLIPTGTGNDFVRNFTDGDRFFSVDAQLDAEENAVDLIRCNDRYAINMVNVGFDCEVVCKTAGLKRKKWVPSKLAYVLGLVLTLIRKPGVAARIVVDGEEQAEKHFLLNTYGNGCFCGGGFHSNPLASIKDGMIDAIFVRNVSRTRFVSIVGKYKKGTHLVPKYSKVLFHKKAKLVELFFDGDTNVSIDGEIDVCRSLRMELQPGALRFLIPLGATVRNSTEKQAVGATV